MTVVHLDRGSLVTNVTATERDRSFIDLYHKTFDSQVRRAALLVGDVDMARDVVQDAYVELIARWGDVEDPPAYLSWVVLNRCRDVSRRRRVAAAKLPLLAAIEGSEHEVLIDALLALPYNHRAALVLKYYLQMSNVEIARAMQVPVGSVSPWLRRGLAAMRKVI